MTFSTKENMGHVPSYSEQTIVKFIQSKMVNHHSSTIGHVPLYSEHSIVMLILTTRPMTSPLTLSPISGDMSDPNCCRVVRNRFSLLSCLAPHAGGTSWPAEAALFMLLGGEGVPPFILRGECIPFTIDPVWKRTSPCGCKLYKKVSNFLGHNVPSLPAPIVVDVGFTSSTTQNMDLPIHYQIIRP